MASPDSSAQRLRSRLRRQELLADLGQRGLDATDPDSVFDEAVAGVRSVLDVDACGLFECCEADSTARLRTGDGWGDDAIGSTVDADPESAIGRSLAAREPIVGQQIATVDAALFRDHGVSAWAHVPVQPPEDPGSESQEDPWGILGIYTTDRRSVPETAVEFLPEVARVLESAIDTVQTKRSLQAEASLKDRIVEASPVGIIVADVDGGMILANERAEEITGRDRSELVEMAHGDTAWDLVHPSGEPLSIDRLPFNRVLETGSPVSDVTFGIRRPDGQRVWITETAVPLRDDDGELSGVVSEFEDVTDEREYREQSRRLESELAATFDRITDAFFGLDTEWRFTYVNERAAELIDPEGEGLVGENVWEAFPAAVDSTFERQYRQAMDRQEAVSFEEYFPPLSTWFEVRAYPSETGLSVYFRDVTDRKRMERELRETNRALKRLSTITADRDRSFDDKVDRLLELGRDRLGVDVGYLATVDVGDDTFEITHVSDADDALEPGSTMPLSETYCHRTVQSAEPLGFVESPTDHVDESVYETWGLDCYLGKRIEVNGDCYGTLCFEDESPRETPFTAAERSFVTLTTQWLSYELERQQYQGELERYREYTDDVIDAIDDLFYILDADGTLLRWNETFESVTGYTRSETDSMQATDFFDPADRPAIESAIEEAFETGSTCVEAPLRTADGDSIPYEFVGSTLEDPCGKPVLTGIGRDVTERKATQRRLEELVADLEESNERLEQFAYAASHDLQEPLRMVSSYLTLVDRRYGDQLDSDAREFIAFAVDGADRMQEMIDGLLAYSRVDTQGESFQPVEMETVVRDVLADLEVRIEETDATIDVDWDGLPQVYGDPGQLRQLVQNVLDNAITYSGEAPPRISVFAENTGTNPTVSIRDRGIGIDPDMTDEIFDVFNRLHSIEEYDGTGIGLALCRRIVERHEGTIEVTSEPGSGSTFSMTLPTPPEEPHE